MTKTCHSCLFGFGDEACSLPFTKSPKPKYVYIKHKQKGLLSEEDVVIDKCVDVQPRSRKLRDSKREVCPEWEPYPKMNKPLVDEETFRKMKEMAVEDDS